MVLAVKVPKQRAEEVRKRLAEMDLLDQDHQIVAEGDFVFIPVKGDPGEFPVVEKDLPP
ncbi:MAG: tRNA (guanine-N1)-methyltransferase, partial [Candidatus Diapherotrites archaeon]|nr:tRNA (guanine-N1)-methyltransferase [Candidatus Diapherotrites archaeon]